MEPKPTQTLVKSGTAWGEDYKIYQLADGTYSVVVEGELVDSGLAHLDDALETVGLFEDAMEPDN